jgi:signal transduction histidine kinase
MIRISVVDGKDHTEVCVEDDGGGIKPDAPGGMSLGHMGLAGMEERLRALHGRLTVEETEAHGVRICASLPKSRKLEIA